MAKLHTATYELTVHEATTGKALGSTTIASADGRVVDAIQGYVDARTFGARVARLISPTAAPDARLQNRQPFAPGGFGTLALRGYRL